LSQTLALDGDLCVMPGTHKNGDPRAAAADLCNGTSFTNPHILVDWAVFIRQAASKADPERSVILWTDEALALSR